MDPFTKFDKSAGGLAKVREIVYEKLYFSRNARESFLLETWNKEENKKELVTQDLVELIIISIHGRSHEFVGFFDPYLL